eukprot:1539702-Pyramimonas_sp.AAC.1
MLCSSVVQACRCCCWLSVYPQGPHLSTVTVRPPRMFDQIARGPHLIKQWRFVVGALATAVLLRRG